jgi:prophage regulatory protein
MPSSSIYSPEKFMRIAEVIELTGWKRSKLYKAMSLGEFPRQIRLSRKSVAWRASEVADWQLAKIAERDAATKH